MGPPLPREHGAWVILYAPLVIGFAIAGRFDAVSALLLVIAVTAAFLARFAADQVMRGKGKPDSRFWLAVYGTTLALAVAPLLAIYRRVDLLWLGAAAGIVFAVHTTLTLRGSGKRFDRTTAGELLAIAALVTTGPAAVVAQRGFFDRTALAVWILCALFFASGVLHVNMYLDAARIRGEFASTDRSRVARPSAVYHTVFCAAFPLAALAALGPLPSAIATAGVVPAAWRAFQGMATVTNRPPALKSVGLWESAYALWFSTCLIAAFLLR